MKKLKRKGSCRSSLSLSLCVCLSEMAGILTLQEAAAQQDPLQLLDAEVRVAEQPSAADSPTPASAATHVPVMSSNAAALASQAPALTSQARLLASSLPGCVLAPRLWSQSRGKLFLGYSAVRSKRGLSFRVYMVHEARDARCCDVSCLPQALQWQCADN